MDLQPQRTIGPTRRSVSGIYPFRNETPIPFESTLERDFLIRSEFFRSVSEIIAQPVQIPFQTAGGRQATYTPDFLVIYRVGDQVDSRGPRPRLVEVKPERQWRRHWRHWSPKWRTAMRFAKEQGWTFHIHDESRIRDQTLDNIRFLERYRRMDFNNDDSEWLIENIRELGSANMQYLVDELIAADEQSIGITHLWHLLATRRLDCDISRPLRRDSEVWIPTDE